MDYNKKDTSPEGGPLDAGHTSPPQTSDDDTSYNDARTGSGVVPGVVQVLLKEGLDARRIADRLQRDDPHGDDPNVARLRDILSQHRILRAEATFDAPPAGRKREAKPPPGRERYLTIFFATQEDTRDISKKLRDSPFIDRAVPAPRLIPPSSPLTEPKMQPPIAQWYIPRCKIDLAWKAKGSGQFYSGQGVVLADLDWGYLTNHEDFQNRIERTYNAASPTGGPYVGMGQISHGTKVLGLLGAGVNDKGITGVAFGAALWAIQADGLSSSSTPAFNQWASAIDYVRTEDTGGRPKVICLEVETAEHCNAESDLVVNKAVKDAIAAGVVVCVPAGNGDRDAGLDGDNQSFDETGSILVGATKYDANADRNPKLVRSNWGPRVVVSAPGDPNKDITCSTSILQKYGHLGLTSGSTPKVAGTVALMLEANPALSHAEIRDILYNTGTPIADAPAGHEIGKFLDAAAAVAEAQRRAAPVPQPRPARRPAQKNGKQKYAHAAAKHGNIAPSGK